MSVAAVVTAVPVWIGGVSPAVVPTAQSVTPSPISIASGDVSTAPLTPSAAALQRHFLARVAPGLRPMVVDKQTTIAGGLALRTKAERQRKISVSSSKGSHVFTASALSEHDLPSAAMRAYKQAALTIHATQPGCSLPWTLLAGIGRVESDHGRYGGSTLGIDGVPRPAIVGIALNGNGPVAAIRDTDGGQFDGDRVWDRAVGPMQFIPGTWAAFAADGNDDGQSNPNNIYDATIGAGNYLCSAGGNMDDPAQRAQAIFRYNHSDEYVATVMAWAIQYEQGVDSLPDLTGSDADYLPPYDDTSEDDDPAPGTPGSSDPSSSTTPGSSSSSSTTTTTTTTTTSSSFVNCPTFPTATTTPTTSGTTTGTTTSTTTSTTTPTTTTTISVPPGCPTPPTTTTTATSKSVAVNSTTTAAVNSTTAEVNAPATVAASSSMKPS
ncbi:MAG: lytic transglycosylase domain-containing protein [Umezawaea sp.]